MVRFCVEKFVRYESLHNFYVQHSVVRVNGGSGG